MLAAGEMSESFARTICAWTDKLPEECRPDADEILLGAAGNGMGLRDLAGLAGEIYARSLPANPDEDQDQAFDRPLNQPMSRLQTPVETRYAAAVTFPVCQWLARTGQPLKTSGLRSQRLLSTALHLSGNEKVSRANGRPSRSDACPG